VEGSSAGLVFRLQRLAPRFLDSDDAARTAVTFPVFVNRRGRPGGALGTMRVWTI
jgi:hypothetical protein